MPNSSYLRGVMFIIVFAFAKATTTLWAQQPIVEENEAITKIGSAEKTELYNPLKPARAAFYAAIFPGLGQAYNKDYWKLPLVYGALGSTIYGAVYHHNESERFRTAFKERLAGRLDEFSTVEENGSITLQISNDGLLDAQDQLRRTKELYILLSVGVYVLQILEANVDAHLSQFDVDPDLSVTPDLFIDDTGRNVTYGLRLTYQFK